MSFVVKAVKKVFKKVTKFVKRVVRSDWFKVVAIAALAVFTGGLAAGGFAAFGSAMSAAGGGLTGFFSAVGQTMATGWTAISNFVTGAGFTAEAATTAAPAATTAVGTAATDASLASAAQSTGVLASGVTEGTAAMAGTAAEAAGVTLPTMTAGNVAANVATGVGTIAPAAATPAATNLATGFLSKVGKAFTANNTWGTFMRNAVVSGISGYFEEKDRKRQEFYFRNRTVWGGPAFGGTSEGLSLLSPRQRAKSSVFDQTPQQEEAIRQQEEAPTPEQTFGQNNLLAMESPAEQAQRAAQAQIPQPTQPPPTNRPPDRRLLGVPENLGVNYNA